MKKITCLGIIVMIMLTTNQTNAQNLIAVQNSGAPSFFTKLDDAVNNAQNGDTIYISGGPYKISDQLVIDKELHLIGAGHHPDSTKATYQTKIFANIALVTGSNNSTFEGLYLTGYFLTGTSALNEDVDNIKISRCSCSGINLSRFSSGWLVIENIVNGNLMGYTVSTGLQWAQNNSFSNNIIEGGINNFGKNNLFSNNICLVNNWNYIYYIYYSAFTEIDNCVLENNIFLMLGIQTTATSCILNNNLFVFNFTMPDGFLGNNNIANQTQSSIFIDQTGNKFNYNHNYHLKPESPGKNAGRDGTDIGIYGGAFPWKEGSIPSNPHFQIVKIGPKTDSNGNLNVNIKVAAQDN